MPTRAVPALVKALVKDGWVWILDSMKTLLETGNPLPRVRDYEGVVDAARS
jgi:hypothetical protein